MATLRVLPGILAGLARLAGLAGLARLTVLPELAWLSVLSEVVPLRTRALSLMSLLLTLVGGPIASVVSGWARACGSIGAILRRWPIVRLLLRLRILTYGRAVGSGGRSPGAAIVVRPVFPSRGPGITARHGDRGRGPLIPGLGLLIAFFG